MTIIINHKGVKQEFLSLERYIKKRGLCMGDTKILLEAFIAHLDNMELMPQLSTHDEELHNPITG